MGREILFEEQAISGFQLFEMYGMYAKSIIPAPFALTVGENYIVAWDDDEYPVTAVDISALFPGGVAVGNGSGFGLPGNNEPFIVAVFETDITLFVLDPTDTRDTHSSGAYKEIKEETPVNIILRNPMGEEEEYPMHPMIELDTTDGNTALYSKGEVLDSITIEPDFSAGDMTVDAPDGYLVKSAVIAKPASLVPENIPVGINIAGVDGAREEAGGGGGNTPCVLRFVNVTASRSVTSSTSLYVNCIAQLPLQSTIIDIVVGEHGIYTSSTTSGQTVYFSSYPNNYLKNPSNYTINIKDYETYKKVSIDYSIVINNTAKQKLGIGGLIVLFTIPGLYYTSNADGTVDLFADNSLVALPMYNAMPSYTNNIDLSNSSITNIPTQCFKTASCKKLILPSTITTIEANGLQGVLEDSNATIDFSRATAVPTKADTVKAVATVLVPAALYSQWTSATNWSGNIVAV